VLWELNRFLLGSHCKKRSSSIAVVGVSGACPEVLGQCNVRKQIGIDITDIRGVRYKQFNDLLDGIFCAYLAYYYWYWGGDGCWVVGDISTGYVTLPRCRLKNCEIAAENLITLPATQPNLI
jgi:predicted RNase H-like nuclease